jgi:hypothetical protein
MDTDQAPIDTFIADLEADDAPRHVPNQSRGPLAKKLMFSSQEMLEEQAAVFTVPLQSMISLKTLFVLTKEEMQQKGTPICNKKKERKRNKKGEAASTSVRPAARVLDRLSTPWRKMQYLGKPMQPSDILKDMGAASRTCMTAYVSGGPTSQREKSRVPGTCGQGAHQCELCGWVPRGPFLY